jgi:hypothetical protein
MPLARYNELKMNNVILLVLLAIFTAVNISPAQKINNMKDQKPESNAPSDTIPKVTGIGGIFFFSENPAETREWYAKNLGLETNEWGSSFEFRNANRPDEINYLQWSPFKKDSKYYEPSKK